MNYKALLCLYKIFISSVLQIDLHFFQIFIFISKMSVPKIFVSSANLDMLLFSQYNLLQPTSVQFDSNYSDRTHTQLFLLVTHFLKKLPFGFTLLIFSLLTNYYHTILLYYLIIKFCHFLWKFVEIFFNLTE